MLASAMLEDTSMGHETPARAMRLTWAIWLGSADQIQNQATEQPQETEVKHVSDRKNLSNTRAQ